MCKRKGECRGTEGWNNKRGCWGKERGEAKLRMQENGRVEEKVRV